MAFNNLIGNDKIKSLLQKAIENNNILHTYMFLGIDGIGKFLFVKEFEKINLVINVYHVYNLIQIIIQISQ